MNLALKPDPTFIRPCALCGCSVSEVKRKAAHSAVLEDDTEILFVATLCGVCRTTRMPEARRAIVRLAVAEWDGQVRDCEKSLAETKSVADAVRRYARRFIGDEVKP